MFNPTYIDLPAPPMGGKCYLLADKGMFVLQRGGGVLRTIACTHAGSGSIIAYDGLPDERGFMDETARQMYRANPAVMGSWMLDAGFVHGLTILASGGTESASAIASIVYLGHDKPKR